MRISTRGRYALRLMLDLATNYTGKPIRLKDVAKRQEISDKYLEQIISILNKAGFVRSPSRRTSTSYKKSCASSFFLYHIFLLTFYKTAILYFTFHSYNNTCI